MSDGFVLYVQQAHKHLAVTVKINVTTEISTETYLFNVPRLFLLEILMSFEHVLTYIKSVNVQRYM